MFMLSSYQSHLKAFGIGVVLAALGVGAYMQFGPSSSEDLPPVTVYKSPSCNCCAEWITHMKEQDFPVEIKSRFNVKPVKKQVGLPSSLAACHTAVVDSYVVEGHVPAQEVKQLLRETPDVRGLAVPGMPVGSPGMERGDRVEPYEVVTFTPSGETSVFAQYGQ
ncbi:MAG: CopG family transcriptional regulator [Bacteroidetes bacterium SW_11_64_17]|nr:MAG: CopG family transcriptional regulator [Bacteroidetes bacterium SW_11_64_17]